MFTMHNYNCRRIGSVVFATGALVLHSLIPSSPYAMADVGGGAGSASSYPPLDLVEAIIVSTAALDFAGDASTYAEAVDWHDKTLLKMLASGGETHTPHLACARYQKGREARTHLERDFSTSAVLSFSHTTTHGACFIVTASPAGILAHPAEFGLLTVGPFLPVLKLAPTLLDHDSTGGRPKTADGSARSLSTVYGEGMKADEVRGLTLRLSPGVLRARGVSAQTLIKEWRAHLMSESLDVRVASFWSDPAMFESGSGLHRAATHSAGAVRSREWTRAAEVVHAFAGEHGKSPGEVCAWDRATVYDMGDDLLLVQGMRVCGTVHANTNMGTKLTIVGVVYPMGARGGMRGMG